MKYLFLSLHLFVLFAGNLQAQFEANDSVLNEPDSKLPASQSSIPFAIEPAPLSTERPELIDETLTLRGQITDFDFTQPETRLLLDTEFERWELIAPSAVELRRLGWTSSSLFSGELVEVEAVRLLGIDPTGIRKKANLKTLTRANGALLLTSISDKEPGGFESIAGGMYSLDTDHSNLEFSYNHLGFSELNIAFERVNANVLWNSNNPELSIIQLNIDVSSLRSGVAVLDDTLRGEEFFDSFNYPHIQFRSTQLRLLKWGNLQVDGQLEIKGLNHPVRLNARLNKHGINPITQAMTAGLNVTGSVNRSNWGLSTQLPMIKDEINISFNGEFILKTADIPSAFPSALFQEKPQGFIDTQGFKETAPDTTNDNVLQLTQ